MTNIRVCLLFSRGSLTMVQRFPDVIDPLDLSCILGVNSQWEGRKGTSESNEGRGRE